MTAGVTQIVIGTGLSIGGPVWIVAGARGLITGQLTPRVLRRFRNPRGGLQDTVAIAIWLVFWGIGFLALGLGALTGMTVMGIVAFIMIGFGSVLGILRDRYARRVSTHV
jgi:hypothetical protein